MEENSIQTLYWGSFPDTSMKWEGYDQTQIPDATPANIMILIKKINELVEIVNTLESRFNSFVSNITTSEHEI